MEERIDKLEKTNRVITILLVIMLVLILAIVAAAVCGAMFLKSKVGDILPVIERITSLDFTKIDEALKAADKVSKIDWTGLEEAIENFKETGAILGEFNEKMNALSNFFGN